MSKHVAEWLNAYLDGELGGRQLEQVEAHLMECEHCQAELDSLAGLSGLLHEIPMPEFTPPERFAANVNLRLPHRQLTIPRKKMLEIGWWMIPVGLLVAWILVNVSFLIGDVLSGAARLGLLSGVSDWTMFGSSSPAYWSRILAQVGILRGNMLNWAASTEAFARLALPQFTLQLWIALLYLSWIAIWWTRHAPQGANQRLES